MIRMTLLSAALQEYPDLRVVLLIDDPPEPRYAGPYRKLAAARALPDEIQRLLLEPRNRFDLALMHYEEMGDTERELTVEEITTLAEHYEFAAAWINELVEAYDPSDHNERFFANHVLGQLGSDLAVTGVALRAAAEDDPAKLPPARVAQLYRRLAWTFRAELSSFERKRYVSLSSDANKAMNLNSYIGLMGGRYSERLTPAGRVLVPVEEGEADLVVPHSRLRAHPGRRQRDPARVLPAAGVPARARREPQGRRRPGSLQRVPRRRHPDRADRRRHHRPAAHHPPGDDLLRRILLGRGQRDPAQAGARRRRGDRVSGRLADSPLHPGPDGDRGHRVDDRPGRARMGDLQLPRAPELQRHSARLRRPVHSAPSLGQRRAADHLQAAPLRPRAALARRAHLIHRAAAAAQLHGLGVLQLAVGAVLDGVPLQRAPAVAADLPGGGAVLPGHGHGPPLLRLQARSTCCGSTASTCSCCRSTWPAA